MQPYEAIQNALQAVQAHVGPAAAQGMLNGMRVAAPSVQPSAWIAWVLEGTEPKGESALRVLEVLTQLFEDASSSIHADLEGFRLLLPADQQPLPQRCAELAAWCDGFLFGLGSQGDVPSALLHGEPGEALQSLTAIATLDQSEEPGEADQDEFLFLELAEFVRISVLLLAASNPALRRVPGNALSSESVDSPPNGSLDRGQGERGEHDGD